MFEDEDVTLPGNRLVRFVGEAGCAALAHASLGAPARSEGTTGRVNAFCETAAEPVQQGIDGRGFMIGRLVKSLRVRRRVERRRPADEG
jgi:hypothetical protein